MPKVTLNNLDTAISDILSKYADDTTAGLQQATKEVAQAGAKAINSEAGAKFKGKKYRSSWTYEVKNSRFGSEATIYSKKPGLPHLLEHGHAVRGGGRAPVPGKPHIEPVNQEIERDFERKVRARIT